MKKILSLVLASLLVLVAFPVFAVSAEENVYYVEAGSAGIGTDDDPFGTLEEAIAELDGEDGTIYVFGPYDISGFNQNVEWEGTITIAGGSDDAILSIVPSGGSVFTGDVIFKDITFDIGQYAHLNPLGGKMTFDLGDDGVFTSFMHISSYENQVVDTGYFVMNSGTVAHLYFGGGYSTSYSSGVVGDTTLEINGGVVSSVTLAADFYMDNMTGISVGGNANILFNGGQCASVNYNEEHKMEILGALNLIFNNGMQKPETFEYPDSAAGGTFIIMSDKGGMIYPTEEIGIFKVKADEGKVAVINGEQVLNGKVTFEEGETTVTWAAFDGEQPADEEEAPVEQPTEIKLTIGKAEIITNGESKALDVPAQIIDSRTMVPLRAIFEALGASVEWDDATKTVTSEKGDTKVSLTIGKAAITVNGVDKALDVPAQIVDSRTLVPVRAIAEAYGCEVGWDDPTKTVTITK